MAETLAKVCLQRPQDWDDFIPTALFAYRTARHETTRHTPFYLLYGREATYPIEITISTYPHETQEGRQEGPTSDVLLRRALDLHSLAEARNEARQTIGHEQQRQQRHYDRTARPRDFAVQDLVMRYDSSTAQTHSGKLRAKWEGPFRVQTVLGKGVYRLATLDGQELDRPINARRLKLYRSREQWKPQVIIDVPAPFVVVQTP